MRDSDAIRAAPDSILMLMTMMDPSDRYGVIGFGTEAVPLQPLAHFAELRPQAMLEAPYTGYTNTGAALNLAMDWLEPARGSAKLIVILTDGEIMLPVQDQTLRAVQQFYWGIERASQARIPIYIYRIKSDELAPEYHINSGYMETVSGTSEELLENLWQWKFVKDMQPTIINIPLEKQDGLNTVKLPLAKADRVRYVLRSSAPGNAWFGNERTGPVLKGNRVKIFEFQNVEGPMELRLDYPAGTELSLDALVEAGGRLKAEAEDRLMRPGIEVKITPLLEDSDSKLLADSWFNGKMVQVTIDGEAQEGTVQDGTILLQTNGGSKDRIQIEHIAFEDLDFVFTGEQQISIEVRHHNQLAVLFMFCGIALILGLLLLIRHKREGRRKRRKVDLIPPDAGIAFRGRLSIYVMHTADERDIPPVDYPLQRRYTGKGVALDEILQSSGIQIDLPDADKIILGPFNRGIYVLNYSDYKVTKRHEVIASEGRAELFFGESIYIASQDGNTEILLMYKKM